MTMEFCLLGDIEVRDGDRLIDVGHARQRCVLVALLFDANRVVPVHQLMDRVWGGQRLPASPAGALQTYVSLLRRSVTAEGEVAIVWQASGYKVVVDVEAVDLHRFRRLAGKGRAAADDERAAVFEEALGLWRGEAFAGLDTPWIGSMRTTLAMQRLAVQQDLIEVQLRRGRHATVAAELPGLVAEHPLDERLAGQYMAALYGSGRQAEALAHYQQIRRRFVDKLGSDPGPSLQRLHQRILNGDPALAIASAAEAGNGTSPRAAFPFPPRQLPADVPGFTGRARHLAELDRLLAMSVGRPGERRQSGRSAEMVIAVVTGAPGVGKTALAVHWGQQVAGRFPDGQLYVDLRGFNPDGLVMEPAEAVRGLLESLGVPGQRLPATLDAQTAMYRSLLSGRRVLVVLDNARDTRQVRWLLPGTPTCLVVVTSRNQLSGLVADGARPLALGVLPAAEARALLARRLGTGRVSAEPRSAEEIIARCAGLPLALAIVAARAVIHPRLPLRALAAELRDQLAALAGESPATSVRAVFSWSYKALSPVAARLFRLLSLHPGPDIGAEAAAALSALDQPQTRQLLAALTQAHLLEEPLPGRYRFHDLIRAFAAEQAQADEAPANRAGAAERLLAWYLNTAAEAGRHLTPGHRQIELGPVPPGCQPLAFAGYEQALAWCDAEHPSVVACVRLAEETGHDDVAWKLPVASWSFFVLRKPRADWIACARIALGAARRGGDRFGEAWVLNGLGLAYADRQPAEAIDCFRQALRVRHEIADRLGVAAVLNNLGAAHWTLREFDDGLDCFQQALVIAREIGNRYSEVIALNNLGEALHKLGRFTDAIPCHQEALTLAREMGYQMSEAVALNNLGESYHATGQLDGARGCFRQALAARQHVGDRHGEAHTLGELGNLLHHTGQPAEARRSWLRAVAILDELGAPGAAELRLRLDQAEAEAAAD
jgi:DNA-binding SARP family transcriptional activator/tetratricopeptide (TPR) repeat protein